MIFFLHLLYPLKPIFECYNFIMCFLNLFRVNKKRTIFAEILAANVYLLVAIKLITTFIA